MNDETSVVFDVDGALDFKSDFGNNGISSPFQDGSYAYLVIPGSGSGTDGNNAGGLYNAIKRGEYFVSRREEQLNTTHYFCRATNQKFNFSNNPTFFTASDGALTNASFKNDPKAYITTVGLYNDTNELLAVAKLSKPILKSFSREAIVKVKLDY